MSPKIRTSEWGIVPVGFSPARRAPAGVEAPTQPPDDRRVVEDVGDVRVDVASPEADDRIRGRDLDALAGRRRPAGRLGEHPEHRRLVQPEPAIARPDAQDDLLGLHEVAVVERLDRRLDRVGVGEDVAEQVLGLIDAAQHGVLAGEDLHRDERVHALLLEDALGTREVDVGRVAGQDLVRGSRALMAHQSVWTPAVSGRASAG